MKEKTIPQLEWKEGNNLAVYCHTHNALMYFGDSHNKISSRVLKGRIQEHVRWWGPEDHDISYIFPNKDGETTYIDVEYNYTPPEQNKAPHSRSKLT